MPRKKSVKSSAAKFNHEVDKLTSFLSTMKAGQSGEHQSWLYNYGIIRLYIEFEKLMLDVLMGAVNNDTTTLQATTGVKFPKHLTDEVCEFLITGTGYFDFKGRSGLSLCRCGDKKTSIQRGLGATLYSSELCCA
jgi:hypothetical protein